MKWWIVAVWSRVWTTRLRLAISQVGLVVIGALAQSTEGRFDGAWLGAACGALVVVSFGLGWMINREVSGARARGLCEGKSIGYRAGYTIGRQETVVERRKAWTQPRKEN